MNNANSGYDRFIDKKSSKLENWLSSKFYRMLVYSPYFDKQNTWYKGGLAYVDSYAIYTNSQLAADHPDWIMRDAKGNKLYIPWKCKHGVCPQYAGDFSNSEFRNYMIATMSKTLALGYKGLWLDDINLTYRTSNGKGNFVLPYDKYTGSTMTISDWQKYFTEYVEQIRASFPLLELAHNVIWYADALNSNNPYVARQIKAANMINIERGVNDAGLTNGPGELGVESFFSYIDYVHKFGDNVILMDTGSTAKEREYGLAAYLLLNNGTDILSNNANNKISITAPFKLWAGYSVNLGNAIGDRYSWNNLLRRDFECGTVLLNEPNSPTIKKFVGMHKKLNGKPISRVTLSSKQGAVLMKSCEQN